MPPSNLRFLLRERTGDLHAAVDAAVGDFLDLADYRRYLVGLHEFRCRCEAEISAAPASSRGSFVPLVPLIEADMTDLGVPLQGAGQRRRATAPVSAEATAGRLYVLEGSSLGARVLAVRARALGLGPDFGARHLAVQSRSSAGFRAFAEWLDGAGLDAEAVVAAALSAFADARRAFTAGTADVPA